MLVRLPTVRLPDYQGKTKRIPEQLRNKGGGGGGVVEN